MEGQVKEMRKINRVKAVLAALLLLACALAAVSASAAKPAGKSAYAGLNDLPPFKFDIHKNGIGYGNCPVYSAPSLDAWRAANGKASISTDRDRVDEAGFVDGWLLVRYEVKSGWRVGYVPPKYVKGFTSSMSAHFGYIAAVADDEIRVTDNPFSHTSSFAMLEDGEEFHVLSRYNYHAKDGYDWWYIECEVDGQVARGFIESDAPFHAE